MKSPPHLAGCPLAGRRPASDCPACRLARVRPAYAALLSRWAAPGATEPTTPPPVPLAESLALLRRIKACAARSKAPCGCQFGLCALGHGRDGVVTADDCRACPDLPPDPGQGPRGAGP